ncbi:phospholipid carrier-dependent glycosyltransferase [Actinotalea sp. M2MS4P-6]|uniref:dolichyl-phosphate-mannose--protein mannosyltransferase n=1 Tax=Actinotalea sp. M2MS4P-6 TaxID=2983762 RepID=UPI0021E3C133|nr:phospholipid carrier-dependent glycosyltransferase [Actinotalea sp. M2MS4P-6]MCV2395786.1 phospholipid carrier-dependent glycosyltransferase [Actinotalea sp. M2MS4P-6]
MRPASVLREHRLRGWLVAAGVTALAAALRLPALGRPHALVFDETYYVKDAWTLMHLGYEAQWPEDPNAAFEAGDVNSYLDKASYVVHPQIGKWILSGGLRLLGAESSVGWRLSSVVAGILAVLLLTRIARRLFRSDALGAAAGLILALDGLAIVHSRTALLDGVLMPLLLAAFGALLIDRDRTAERLERLVAAGGVGALGPPLGFRGWRLLAGVLLGLACGVKWSAIWYVAFFGLLTVGWDAVARRRVGLRSWWQGAFLRDAGPAFVSLVGVSVVVYLAGWFSWFRTPGAYGKTWAVRHPGEGVTWLPDVLRSFVEYHRQMWEFHTHLTSEHTYAAKAVGWLIQWRPTSFYYESPTPAQELCGADKCSQAITSLGNPLIWWLGTIAVAACVWWAIRRHDGIAVAAVSGLFAGWLPWFLYWDRTIFTFYAIVMLPWLALSLTWAGARFLRMHDPGAPPAPRWRLYAVIAAAVLIVVVTAFYYPIWTAMTVPFRFWQLHMWLPSWV